jgi:transcriptional regulatory protein LevR
MDEYAGRDLRAFGSQLGEDIDCHVVVVANVTKLCALEVSLELAHLCAVSVD